ncbi:hypothetical protein Vadar_009094 [Vaccinium darrowii]|uniref:Uncharacterized protein n=1 Tax=Vaccinium darrowii TaxID=229202 RepID=A0ACB7YKK1_9ERIC|nr:hypothetical protein Vadar_009094 [Vaccinium darrowii]
MKLTELENLERLEHGSLSVGSLSKLKEFSVRGCGKLLCVFASQLLPMLRHLEDLFVESCELLEVMFELEGADSNEPNPTILSPLKLIVLRDLPKLNYISKRDPMGFEYIQTLHIYDCSSLKHVFAPTMAKSIPLLCDLMIWKCEMLSRIVAEENGLGESSVEEVEFPQLKRLELGNLPNLVSFFPNVNTTVAQSGDHYHNLVQPQPLFNEKVAIPSLVYLGLFGLKNVRNMFHPSMAGGLVNLQKLLIKDCSTLETVGMEEEVGGHGRILHKTLFPQLIKLVLARLPKLKWFCHFTHPLELPRLRTMDIMFCPSMDAFSLGHVSAPNLSLPGILWNGDLNNAIQSLPKVTFPRLENLELEGCESLKYVFQPSMAKDLVNLQELIINDCSKMEAVVDREEEIEGGQGRKSADKTLFPRLSKLELCRLQQLKRFCHFKYPLELPLLSQMVIWDCPSMDSFSFGYVRAPNLRLQATSRNGKIWR